MAVKTRTKRDPKSHPKKIKTNKVKKGANAKDLDKKEIRRAFQNSTDKTKYAARLLRRVTNGAFGKENNETYNQMVTGTRGASRSGSKQDQ